MMHDFINSVKRYGGSALNLLYSLSLLLFYIPIESLYVTLFACFPLLYVVEK
jgi:hypothetical protein